MSSGRRATVSERRLALGQPTVEDVWADTESGIVAPGMGYLRLVSELARSVLLHGVQGAGFPATRATNVTASLDTAAAVARWADLVGVGWLAPQRRRAAQQLTRAKADTACGGDRAVRVQQRTAVSVPITDRTQIPGHQTPRSHTGQW